MTKRKRWVVGLACIALWLTMLIGWRVQLRDAAFTDEHRERPQRFVGSMRGPNGAKPIRDLAARSDSRLRIAKLIADVQLDKQRVCPGEDLQVRITPAAVETSIDFNVDGQFGNPIILRPKTAGIQTYRVVATDHDSQLEYRPFQVTVLSETSPECAARKAVVLDVRRHLRDTVLVRARAAGLGEPCRYAWDLGDGTQEITSTPWIRHSYESRPQDKRLSSFVITVEVTDPVGAMASSRTAVSYENAYYVSRVTSGNRVLPSNTSRFPRAGRQDLSFEASVRNLESTPVHFDKLVLKQQPCIVGSKPIIRELPTSTLASLQVLEPRETAHETLALPRSLISADACSATLEMIGDTEPPMMGAPVPEGPHVWKPVNALLSFDIRPPNAEEQPGARRVLPPEQAARYAKAAAILGRPQITAEDLELLELDGKL